MANRLLDSVGKFFKGNNQPGNNQSLGSLPAGGIAGSGTPQQVSQTPQQKVGLLSRVTDVVAPAFKRRSMDLERGRLENQALRQGIELEKKKSVAANKSFSMDQIRTSLGVTPGGEADKVLSSVLNIDSNTDTVLGSQAMEVADNLADNIILQKTFFNAKITDTDDEIRPLMAQRESLIKKVLADPTNTLTKTKLLQNPKQDPSGKLSSIMSQINSLETEKNGFVSQIRQITGEGQKAVKPPTKADLEIAAAQGDVNAQEILNEKARQETQRKIASKQAEAEAFPETPKEPEELGFGKEVEVQIRDIEDDIRKIDENKDGVLNDEEKRVLKNQLIQEAMRLVPLEDQNKVKQRLIPIAPNIFLQ